MEKKSFIRSVFESVDARTINGYSVPFFSFFSNPQMEQEASAAAGVTVAIETESASVRATITCDCDCLSNKKRPVTVTT